MPTKTKQSESQKIPPTLREDWWLFCDSYISIAELACRELIHQRYTQHWDAKRGDIGAKKFWAYNLYVPMIYNLKHSIEIFLKYFGRVVEDNIPEYSHDIEKNLELFQKKHNVNKINQAVKKAYSEKRGSKYSLDAINSPF